MWKTLCRQFEMISTVNLTLIKQKNIQKFNSNHYIVIVIILQTRYIQFLIPDRTQSQGTMLYRGCKVSCIRYERYFIVVAPSYDIA